MYTCIYSRRRLNAVAHLPLLTQTRSWFGLGGTGCLITNWHTRVSEWVITRTLLHVASCQDIERYAPRLYIYFFRISGQFYRIIFLLCWALHIGLFELKLEHMYLTLFGAFYSRREGTLWAPRIHDTSIHPSIQSGCNKTSRGFLFSRTHCASVGADMDGG